MTTIRIKADGSLADEAISKAIKQAANGGVFIPSEFRDYLWGLIEIERYRLVEDLLQTPPDELHEAAGSYIEEQLMNLNALRMCFGGAE